MVMDDETRRRFHKMEGSVGTMALQLAQLVIERKNDRDDIDEAKSSLEKMNERLGKIYTALLGLLISVVTLTATLWLQGLRTP